MRHLAARGPINNIFMNKFEAYGTVHKRDARAAEWRWPKLVGMNHLEKATSGPNYCLLQIFVHLNISRLHNLPNTKGEKVGHQRPLYLLVCIKDIFLNKFEAYGTVHRRDARAAEWRWPKRVGMNHLEKATSGPSCSDRHLFWGKNHAFSPGALIKREINRSYYLYTPRSMGL